MGILVTSGAQLMCSFGTAPSSLVVLPASKTMCGGMPAANIMDNVPMTNVMPFGMCISVANPATKQPPPVLFAPAPCMPMIGAPWAPGCPKTLIGGKPAVDNACKLVCNWGGIINVTVPAQQQTTVG